MEAFVDWIKTAGGIASAITAILGLATVILWKPIRSTVKRRKVRIEEEKAFRTQMLGKMDALNANMKALEQKQDESDMNFIRYEMFDFAASCRRGEGHSHEEFLHIFEINDNYNELLKKTGSTNGKFAMAYRYITSVYDEKVKTNDFLN